LFAEKLSAVPNDFFDAAFARDEIKTSKFRRKIRWVNETDQHRGPSGL